MLVYPPFQIMGRGLGYAWIFSPPHDAAIINSGQLLVQWVAVALLAGIAYLLSSANNKERSAPELSKELPTRVVQSSSGMTGVSALRIARGFVGFIGGWQLIGLLPAFSLIASSDSLANIDTGKMAALFLVKLFVATVCFAIFFWLRHVINTIHVRRYGTPHPALTKKWGL